MLTEEQTALRDSYIETEQERDPEFSDAARLPSEGTHRYYNAVAVSTLLHEASREDVERSALRLLMRNWAINKANIPDIEQPMYVRGKADGFGYTELFWAANPVGEYTDQS